MNPSRKPLARESLLWALFIGICFLVGYLKGTLPEYRFSFFWTQEDPVHFLVYSEKLMPQSLVADLEIRTHTKIELDVSTHFNDYLAKSVSQSDYALFILPRSFSLELMKQKLLLPLTGLREKSESSLHPDFQSLSYQIFPWAWVYTVFIKTPTTSLDLKKTSKLQLIEDEDHISAILGLRPEWKRFPKVELITLFEEASEISDNSLREVNHFFLEDYGNVEVLPEGAKSFFIFDVVIPRAVKARKTSIDLLIELLSQSKVDAEAQAWPWGQTRLHFEKSSLSREKKPSALRNISGLDIRSWPALNSEERASLREWIQGRSKD